MFFSLHLFFVLGNISAVTVDTEPHGGNSVDFELFTSCYILAMDVDPDERDADDLLQLVSCFFPIFIQSEPKRFLSLFGEDQHGLDSVDGTCSIWLLIGTNFGDIPNSILPLINLNWVFKLLFWIFPLRKLNLDLKFLFTWYVIFVDDDDLESWFLNLVFV